MLNKKLYCMPQTDVFEMELDASILEVSGTPEDMIWKAPADDVPVFSENPLTF